MKKSFIFGTIMVLAFSATAFSGCHKGGNSQDEEPIVNSFHKQTFVYKNSTAVAVKFEAYDGNSLKESVTIEPGKSLEQVGRIGAGSTGKGCMILDYKTIRVVFGDTKELEFTNSDADAPYNIFSRSNYKTTTLSEIEAKYDYEISKTMMDIATAIKAASAEKLLPTMIETSDGSIGSPYPPAKQTYRFTYDEQSRMETLTWQSIPVGVDVDLPIWISSFEYGENSITVTKISSLEFDPEYVPTTTVTKYEVIGNKVYTNGADPIEIDSKGRAINRNRVYDENGNVISYSYYGQLDLTPKYDNTNGIFRHVNMPSWFLTDGLKVIADPELFLYNNAVVAWHNDTLGSAEPAGHGFKIEYNEYDYPVRVSQYLINIISNGYSSFKVDYIKK